MPEYAAHFRVGDVVEIAGLYADGTREHDDTPRAQYATDKPLQTWRVVYVGDDGVQLHVVTGDPARDAFNNSAGEFWIRPHRAVADAVIAPR